MDSSEKKWLNGLELQKLGVIGVLIFFSQFLMDNISNDNSRLETSFSNISKDVGGLVVSSSVLSARVDLLTTQVKSMTNVIEDKYKTTDAAKDLGMIHREIDRLEKRINDLSK